MKRFFTVFQFELMSYLKNKSFMVSTLLIALLVGAAMFLPSVFDMSDMLGTESKKEQSQQDEEKEEDITKYGIVDVNGYFQGSSEMLQMVFEKSEFTFFDSEDALKKAVEKEDVDAGFLVKDDKSYQYYVVNKDIMGGDNEMFSAVMQTIHKQVYCVENQLDYTKMAAEYDCAIDYEETILGKDATDNYWYCYMLVIAILMIIVFYGVMIATSVTNEKSNRSIEVLVTSVSPNYLLFGKVFAGAVAAFCQVVIILGAALAGYGVNHEAWGNKLDVLLDIPSDVLLAFAAFGIGGFLFYAFLYGAVGALVSKTEDLNKVAGNLQMIIMVVYFVVLFQLTNVDGLPMKVCSYLPFSSYSAMFVRIAMGKVAAWEVAVSFVILVASTVFAGWIGAKIYRMGTLRYGNPIKITSALKSLKSE